MLAHVIRENPTCRQCGKKIDAPPYRRAGGECCCEGCFLRGRQWHAEASSDADHHALAEALAAALDLREQETGLHSKRVAYHTLVLAKRFTNDREKLRQIYWGALLHDVGKIAIPDAIPFGARLFAVVDTLDAMTSDRPYRRGLPFDAAKAEIQRFAGTQFDPAAVEAFIAEGRVLREMVAVKCAAEWSAVP